jgi:uncharacterized protein (TIGR03083 family)
MSEVSVRYGSVTNGFTARALDVAPDQWSLTTPCSEWTVRDLVAHVITTQRRVLATVEGGEAMELDPDEDLTRAWAAASGAVMDAVAHCAEFLGPLDEAIRRPGGFAEKVESPSDADEQRRFLNFCGRAV